jgi:hypothetical protein
MTPEERERADQLAATAFQLANDLVSARCGARRRRSRRSAPSSTGYARSWRPICASTRRSGRRGVNGGSGMDKEAQVSLLMHAKVMDGVPPIQSTSLSKARSCPV